MQKEIVSTVQDTSNLVTYLTTFSLHGCEGNNHRVLVFPVRGPSFSDTLHIDMDILFPGTVWPFTFKSFSMATRMSAARQLLKALECLHKAGIVHNGGLTPACCSLNVCMLIILQI
jgi:serine/threonine protein kinase